jgi:uncharacterized repeat protein (TIGR01451 family)
MHRSRPLTFSRMSRVTRYLAQIGCWIALTAIPLLTLGSAQRMVAQTTILVTTTQQGVTDPSHCSLQEAIYAAEFGSNTALNLTDPDRFYTTGCVLQGASGPFTIVLQNTVYSFNTSWDRDAHNPFGLTATPIIFANITIQGNGATLEWTGTENSRLFAVGSATIFDTLDNKTVSGTGALRLESVYIKGFKIKGGNGACGGAGGLGAGGAIYVGTVGSGAPTLDVEDSTFDSNFAIGGNGSHSGCESVNGSGGGGGGGGLSGNGGISGGEGGGGGGGGSRGNGGDGLSGGGGGGGGTIFDGADSEIPGGPGGYLCGGGGGGRAGNGHGGSCPGGGGGGGGQENLGILTPFGGSDGADGNYGGGGGGGGSDSDNSSGSGSGGNGGFGGGGGGSGTVRSHISGSHGGNGGFGGGSGFGVGTDIDLHGEPGDKAPFGGSGNGSCCGGGGGALGAAIFNESGSVFIRNSTFTNNDVDRGEGGVNDAGTDRANKGADAGAAIFSLNGSLVIENTTISGNFATGSDNQAGGGVVVVAFPLVRNAPAKASLFLSNTILSRNGSNDCLLRGTSDPTGGNNVGTIDANGSGNLILNNNGCPGVAVSADPQLAPLALDPRSTIGTPTMALPSGSPAIDAADDSHFLSRDQRGVTRPQGPHSDIGAFEFVPVSADLSLTSQTSAAQIVAGDSFTYTVQLTNSGPNDAADVVFSDLAPAGVTFSSCSSTVGTCTVSGGGARLSLATLPNGETVTITIQATLSASVSDGTALANTPSLTSSTFDPNAGNNSGSAGSTSITVQNKSDLLVTTASSLNVVNFGGTLTYTVTVTNLGPFEASAVTLVDPVPAQAIFLSMNSGGTSCTSPAPAMGGTVTCSFGSMASGASATVSFTVRVSVPPVPASITNTAVLSSPNFDPNPTNNSASVKTLVFGNKRL